MVCDRNQEKEDKKNKINKKWLLLHLGDVFLGPENC